MWWQVLAVGAVVAVGFAFVIRSSLRTLAGNGEATGEGCSCAGGSCPKKKGTAELQAEIPDFRKGVPPAST